MANEMRNRIVAKDRLIRAKIKQLLIHSEDDHDVQSRAMVDFNLLVPMPSSVNSPQDRKQWTNYNWGTGVNGYDTRLRGILIEFSTNWSYPLKVAEKLAEKIPTGWEWFFADEHVGPSGIVGGFCPSSKGLINVPLEDPILLACELHGYDYDQVMDDLA